MTTEIYLVLAIVSSSAMTLVLKLFSFQEGNRYGIILGNYLTCIVTAFFMLPDRSVIARADGKTLLLGIIAGVIFVVALLCLQSSIRACGAILTSAFSKMGLVVPLVFSILLWGERPGLWQILGIVLVIAAVWVINGKQDPDAAGEGSPGIQLFWLLAVMLSCGVADTTAKVFETYGERSKDGLYFLILFCTAAILALGLLLHERHRTGAKLIWKQVLAGIAVGIPNYFSSVLLLRALTGLPAIIVYPCFSIGTVLLITLVSTVFFHEPLDKRKIAGLAIILLSVILLNIS
jgi:drug/metabolite transporter (DMT)-like permease